MAVRIVTSVSEARAACDAARGRGQRIGFVPTMGGLHAGHLALVDDAKRRARFVVASIFVNPTQFGPHEDLARYPRDLDGDVSQLASAGVDLVFAPDGSEMYPDGDETRVRVGSLAEPLEGTFRPGHFDGVTTVVAKLFAVVGPCVAIFGRKDYQQHLVVRRMTRDLLLSVEIVGHPIVREADGLALSTRNRYLSPEERARALSIVHGLDAATRRCAAGERSARKVEQIARDAIERAASSIDYVEARDADSLAPIKGEIAGRALLAVACHIGSTRLIDNVVLGEDAPPLG